MNAKEMLHYVDHTQLKAFATWEDIEALCEEAIEYKTASVCIPPSYISRVKETYGDKINICTVIGFPLGYQTTAVKFYEAKDAIDNGASEIDMVVNIGDVKNKDFDKVTSEIKALKEAVGANVLKVIIETCYLTEEEKIILCKAVTEAGADFIKTSTGFGGSGATFDDINLFSKHINENIKMKAAGGISSLEDAKKFIELGAERLGTSKIVKLIKEAENG